MIRICSYCKIVMGEKEPFEDKSETHGICEKCMKKVKKQIDEYNKNRLGNPVKKRKVVSKQRITKLLQNIGDRAYELYLTHYGEHKALVRTQQLIWTLGKKSLSEMIYVSKNLRSIVNKEIL